MIEKYNPFVRSKDKNKLYVNKLLKELSKKHNRFRGNALILDSEKLITLKHLKEAGFRDEHIHIPNPYVYDKIRKYHTYTYNWLLSEYLDKHLENSKKYSLAFFDYMATLDGNKTTKIFPKEDIDTYFKKKMPADNSIFAITISMRNGNSKGNCNDVSRLTNAVTEAAYKNGYVATMLPDGYGYNGMYFAIFEIHKIKQPTTYEPKVEDCPIIHKNLEPKLPDRKTIIEMRKKGMDMGTIANKLGVTKSKAYWYLKLQ